MSMGNEKFCSHCRVAPADYDYHLCGGCRVTDCSTGGPCLFSARQRECLICDKISEASEYAAAVPIKKATQLNVAFDVDDTLWKVCVREVEGRKTGSQVPDYELIPVLKWFHDNGHNVFVWSAGGIEYAQAIVDKLGLTHMVSVIAKANPEKDVANRIMDIAFDDCETELAKVDVLVKRPKYE